jgi:hypothetical protein
VKYAEPVSSALLSRDGTSGLGLLAVTMRRRGPSTILLVPVIFCVLTDRPQKVHWLSPPEKRWFEQRAACEQGRLLRVGNRISVRHLRTLVTVCLAIGTSGIGTLVFLPLIMLSMRVFVSNSCSSGGSFALALPLGAAIWMYRSSNREGVVAAACCGIAAGLFGTADFLPSRWMILWQTLRQRNL